MDTRLEKALELSKSLEAIDNQKSIALSKFKQNQIFYYNGGTFVADMNLLSAVLSLKSFEDDLILVDINNIPIKLDNIEEFVFVVQSKVLESTRQYYLDFQEIKKIRTPKGLLEK